MTGRGEYNAKENAGMSGGNHIIAHIEQMEGTDYTRSSHIWNAAFWGTCKVDSAGVKESIDGKSAKFRGGWTCKAGGISGGAAEGRIFADFAGRESENCVGCHAALGRKV